MDIKPVIFEHKQNVCSEQVVSNIRANAGRNLRALTFKSVVVVGSGPSLAKNIDAIREKKDKGFSIATMNGSYAFLVDNGIVPDYYFQVDARKSVNLPFIRNPQDDTEHVIASQCDPEIFEALRDHCVTLWQVGNASYDGAEAAIREIKPDATVFGGSCNVGHSALNALVAKGYRIMHLYGFDGPTRDGATHAFPQPQNDGDEMLEFFFDDQRFVGSATSAHDAQAFVQRYRMLRNMGIDIRVCGSDALLPTMVKAAQRVDDAKAKPVTYIPPKPVARTKPVEKLQVVCWKWEGHIPYTAEHVNVLARMVDRNLRIPHEIVCITDKPEGIDGGVRIIPMWRDNYEHGKDWHRLKIFAPEMVDIIGPRFVSMDLDTVICDDITPIFDNDHPFIAWKDPNRSNQYCTALFQMDAGAFPHVLSEFDVGRAMQLRNSGKFTGYDQAWISEVLPYQPMWTPEDGVISFKIDVLEGGVLPKTEYAMLPYGAKIVNFHGQYDPTHANVKAACPWIDKFYV